MVMLDFKTGGMRVAVTGANGFLGKHICSILKENFVKVIPIDLHGRDINKVDISNIKQLCELSKQIGRDGYLDGLINNAAVSFKGNNITSEEFKKTLDINIQGTNNCILALESILKPSASIINVASVYGIITPDFKIYDNNPDLYNSLAYGASKAGIIQLTKYHAKRLAPIRVNAISPGGIFDNHSDDFIKKYCDRVPLGRMADPKEIVSVMIFLLSEISSYITGQNIVVDGGLTT